MLSTNIHSKAELISIALAAEREAIRRYTELAGSMRQHGNDEACALFERMVVEEQGHEKLLLEWAERDGLEISTDIGPIRWEDPGVSTIYDAEAKDPDQSTPYKALAFAVHNEERAFRFYAYVAANSKDPGVCDCAELLAQEELGHAALLRAMRRRAWHKERSQHGNEPTIDPRIIHTTPDLLVATVCIEQFITALIDTATDEFPDLQALVTKSRELLSSSEKSLSECDTPGEEISAVLQPITSWCENTLATMENTAAALRRLCADSDRSFEFYDAVVTSTQDESVMLMAQQLSSHALDRIGELRRVTGGTCER